MLVLLPPSEGKTAPRRGRPLDLGRLDLPVLTDARAVVVEALVELCSGPADEAARMLGLGATQLDEVARNARLATAPAMRADRVYSGVLYDALDLASISGPARGRATRWLAITSSLLGLLRPADAIPAYRLAGGVSLPGLGGVAAHWRRHLDPAVREAAGSGLVVDLRSSTYAGFWRPGPDLAPRVATVRVLHEQGGKRSVVSHFNKATKGRLVRSLLEDGGRPRTPTALAEHLAELGWHVETGVLGATGQQLDVVVREL